jgi:hypothetical protein
MPKRFLGLLGSVAVTASALVVGCRETYVAGAMSAVRSAMPAQQVSARLVILKPLHDAPDSLKSRVGLSEDAEKVVQEMICDQASRERRS